MADLVSLESHPEFARLRQALVTHEEPTSKQPQRADVSKKLGEKMLSGWCLRAEHCPLCHTPIMSKGGDMFCFGCDLPVRREEDLPPNFAIQKPVSQTETQVPKASEEQAQVEERVEKSEAPVAQSGELVTVHTAEKKTVNEDSLDLPPLESDEEDEDFEFDAEAFAIARKKSDEVSEKIGKHMLMGWTLMDVHCATDSCPLMRSADHKSMVCLSCGTEYVEDPEDVDDAKAPPSKSANDKSKRPAVDDILRAPSSLTSSSVSSVASSSASSVSSATSHSSPASSPAPYNSSSGLNTELAAVEAAVTNKLTWARRKLEDTQDMVECRVIADTLNSLLVTVKELHTLKVNH